MPEWLEFELLAEQIYRELKLVPGAVATHNDRRVWGYDSLGYRQIDVTVRWTDSDGEQRLLIVQARDRDTPADVNATGELIGVISDVRADRAILVCRSGFTARAKNQAKSQGIELHNLHDAQSVKWSQALKIPILWVDKSPELRFAMEVALNSGDGISPLEILVLGPAGARQRYVEIFRRLWDATVLARGPGQHCIDLQNRFEIRVSRPDGVSQSRAVDRLGVTYTVHQRAWLGHFEPDECRGIIDHLESEVFTASHLPLGQIPVERGPEWVEIDDPDAVSLRLRGTFATSENISVDWHAPEGSASLRYLGPVSPDHHF